MGLDFYDVMGAAGEGLSIVGAEKKENRKEELRQKLEIEKEERGQQYEKNREDRAIARDKAKPDGPPAFTQQTDGTFQKIYKNSYGKELSREPATAAEVEDFNMGQQAKKVTLENLITDGGYKKALTNKANAEVAGMPLDDSLKRREAESRINENNAQASRAMRPDKADKDDEVDDSIGGLTNVLVKEMADLNEAYPDIDAAEFRRIAQSSIKAAAKHGRDARVIFEDALRRYKDPQGK